MIRAFHSNWTRPFFVQNKNAAYCIKDYDILCTALSALQWRKVNGAVKMITDSTGAAYYHSLGIAHFWNGGISTALDAVDEVIDPLPFWAAGKLYALRGEAVPCVMLDTDFIVWKPLEQELENTTLAVIHREGICDSTYPPKTAFEMYENYAFSDVWDWSVLPCNTAFLYIADADFKDYYTREAMAFMKGLKKSKDVTVEMVFAEQRILAMCAGEKNIPIKNFLDMQELDDQTTFTHIWSYKGVLARDKAARRDFCQSCLNRLIRDFPEETGTLEKIDSLRPYFK
jgi:hypothetical protein